MNNLKINQQVTIHSVMGKAIVLTITNFKKIGTCWYAQTIDEDGQECPFPVKFLSKAAN